MSNYSKEQVKRIIQDEKQFEEVFQQLSQRDKTLFLKKIGKIDFKFESFNLLTSIYEESNDNLRKELINTLSKTSNIKLLSFYKKVLTDEKNSEIRRETVSALGRMRNKKSIPTLIELTNDKDPNVILQSIRGLLVFKDNEKVIKFLKKLKNHPNEIVKMVIENELFSKTEKNLRDHADVNPKLRNKIIKGNSLDVLKKN